MNLIKQYIIAVIFTALTCIPLLCSVYFHVSQIQIEREMESALEKLNLVEVKVCTSEIIWLKPGKEILVNGDPFDIKQYWQQGPITIFKGLFDKKEKELKKKFLAYQKGHQSKEKQDIFKIIFQCFFLQANKPISQHYDKNKTETVYGIYLNAFIKSIAIPLLYPPPDKFAC